MSANLPIAIEIECSQLISAEHSAQHATSHANKTKLMRAIAQLANPYIETLNERLAALISHEYPDPEGGLLLPNALGEAAQAYADCAEMGGRMEECELAYITTLLRRATGLAEYAVHGIVRRKSEQWRPFAAPLIEWAQHGKFEKLVFKRRAIDTRQRHAALVFLIGSLLTFERATLVEHLLPHSAGCACVA